MKYSRNRNELLECGSYHQIPFNLLETTNYLQNIF